MSKKLFIEAKNNKFINNLINADLLSYDIISNTISKNIYEIFYKTKFTTIIVNDTSIDNELSQFIVEYGKNINIYVYQDQKHSNLTEYLTKFVHRLIPEYFHKPQTIHDNLTIIPNNLVNEKIFYRNNDILKDNSISFFLDIVDEIPDFIKYKLYPASLMKIKLYNNFRIKHYQNLGMLSENEKNIVLNQSTYFINYNNYYVNEAMLCGCKILDMLDIDTNNTINIPSDQNISYTTFMKELLS